MMEVQKFLIENGLQKLKEKFEIEVREYPEKGICVLNYSMIDSPRFHPICDECRSLILRKDSWEILACSFVRFFNWQESIRQNDKVTVNTQRISSYDEYCTKEFDLTNAIVETKIDGSIISLWWDNIEKTWNTATRSMAYGEGETNFGRTFHDLFMATTANSPMWTFIKNSPEWQDFTIVFEITSPENRIVTPYTENKAYLIGCRYNKTNRELSCTELDNMANAWGFTRPKYFKINNYKELIDLIGTFKAIEEGVVLKIENENGSHWRIKAKNPAYLAIANLRANGKISPKRILDLIIRNDQIEYLKYFPEDEKYFNFVELEYNGSKNRIKSIYNEHMAIQDQKEFALTIMPKTVYSFEKGIIFSLRKSGGTVEKYMGEIGAKKIALGMNLKKKFSENFFLIIEEEDDENSR